MLDCGVREKSLKSARCGFWRHHSPISAISASSAVQHCSNLLYRGLDGERSAVEIEPLRTRRSQRSPSLIEDLWGRKGLQLATRSHENSCCIQLHKLPKEPVRIELCVFTQPEFVICGNGPRSLLTEVQSSLPKHRLAGFRIFSDR